MKKLLYSIGSFFFGFFIVTLVASSVIPMSGAYVGGVIAGIGFAAVWWVLA